MKTFNVFKTLLMIICLVGFMSACTENSSINGEDETALIPSDSPSTTMANGRTTSTTCFITPGLVAGQTCGAPTYGNLYTVYASTNCATTQDRQVTITITREYENDYGYDENVLLEQRVVTIPANQTVSNNMTVFSNATESYSDDDITLTVSYVTVNGVVDNSCTWRTTSPTVNNCYTETHDDSDIVGPDEDLMDNGGRGSIVGNN